MTTSRPLTDLLLRHLPIRTQRDLAGREDIEEKLVRTLEALHEAWPDIALPDDEFLPFLAERLVDDGDPLEALARLQLEDLYLACACVRGDVTAIDAFHARYFPRIDQALRHLDSDGVFTDDIKQMVYFKVFVAPEGGTAKIVQYMGRGSLGKWVQVVAQRTAQNFMRSKARERPLHECSLEQLIPRTENPELYYIKQLYKADLNAAFQQALTTLTSKQRNILRYRLVDGMKVPELAELYHVHRVTVTRWIAAIREQILRETHQVLSSRLEAGSGDVESIVRALRSQIDASVRRFLQSDKAGQAEAE